MNSVPWDLESGSDLGWLMQKIWIGRGGTQCEYILDRMEVRIVVDFFTFTIWTKTMGTVYKQL